MPPKVTKVFFGCDHAGLELKNDLIKYLTDEKKIECVDCGTKDLNSCDYPDYSAKVVFGVVVCGSGMGV